MADYVSKYTGNEVDGILDEAIELPQGSSNDNGKFLKYDSGGVIWDNPIDTSNASDGDVLKYNSNYGFTWDSLPEGLPVHNNGEFDSSILTINNYGDVAWYKAQTNANDGDFLIYRDNAGIIWDNPIDTDEASEGDFLRYGSNGLEWDNPLDTSNAFEGQYLKYSSNTSTGIVWDDPIDTTTAQDGEVLKYSNINGLYWGTPIDTSEADDGEYLKYSSNTGIMWGPVNGALPECNSEGIVLLTMASGNPNWQTVDELNILPFHGSSDAGKVLTVLDNGALGWVSPNQ